MRRLVLLGVLAATAAFLLASLAVGAIPVSGEWPGKAPIVVGVQGIENLPQEERPLFLAAMASWNASPNVEFVLSDTGKVRVNVSTACAFGCSVPDYRTSGKTRRLNAVNLYFNPVIFAWADEQWVFCHELGHALGLGEGYPVEETGDYGSCMAGDGMFPSQMDFDVLAQMYPLSSGAAKR